jgi:hypothetical protein
VPTAAEAAAAEAVAAEGNAGATTEVSSSGTSSSPHHKSQPLSPAEAEQLQRIKHYLQLRPDNTAAAAAPGVPSSGQTYNITWAQADRFRLFGTEFADKPKEKQKDPVVVHIKDRA